MALFRGKRKKQSVIEYYTNLNNSYPNIDFHGGYASAHANVGNYIIFHCGEIGSDGFTDLTSIVESYNKSLTFTALSTSDARIGHRGGTTSNGNYAIIGAGANMYGDANSWNNVVEAYNTSLTRSIITAFSQKRCVYNSVTIGDYVVFAGGTSHGWDPTYLKSAEVYNNSLTHSYVADFLSVTRKFLSATKAGNYALFGGGLSFTSVVDVFDNSLTRISTTNLSENKASCLTASLNNCGIFISGVLYGGGNSKKIDCFNSSLTRSALPELTDGVADESHYSSTGCNNNCVLKDKIIILSSYKYTAELYNKSFTKEIISVPQELLNSSMHSYYNSGAIGDYYIFYHPNYNISSSAAQQRGSIVFKAT